MGHEASHRMMQDLTLGNKGTKPPVTGTRRIKLAILGACLILAGAGYGVWAWFISQSLWIFVVPPVFLAAGIRMVAKALRNGDFDLSEDFRACAFLVLFIYGAFMATVSAIRSYRDFTSIEALESRGVQTIGEVTYTTDSKRAGRGRRMVVYKELVHFTVDGREYTATGIEHKYQPSTTGVRKLVTYVPESPDINQTEDNPKTRLESLFFLIGSAIFALFSLFIIYRLSTTDDL